MYILISRSENQLIMTTLRFWWANNATGHTCTEMET